MVEKSVFTPNLIVFITFNGEYFCKLWRILLLRVGLGALFSVDVFYMDYLFNVRTKEKPRHSPVWNVEAFYEVWAL